VLLVGHFDTVFPPGTFEGMRYDGDLLRGPGVLDMKGGLVVVAFALRALAEVVGLDRVVPVRLLAVSDEEVGSHEARPIIERFAERADAALVFEAGRAEDRIVTARKGTGMVDVHVTGRASHAGANHAEGRNAIWALARWIDAAQALTDYGTGVTVTVGVMKGGTAHNVVPAEATCEVDIRFETRADGERLLTEFEAIARRIEATTDGVSVRVNGRLNRIPLERTAGGLALLGAYAEQAKAVGLGFEEAPLVGGASDANTTAALRIATIDGLGPRGKGFHTLDEQIDAATLVPKARALARFLLARSLARP
jgi:glutamate carboxypeptidase